MGKNNLLSAISSLVERRIEKISDRRSEFRFMTDQERDAQFHHYKFQELTEVMRDGIPVSVEFHKKRKVLDIHLASPMHGMIIGADENDGAMPFLHAMLQILGHLAAGSSMICTDPDGTLFAAHSRLLQERGYKVLVLNLRKPQDSVRWNPLGDIYDRYQSYLHIGTEIYKHYESVMESGLEMVNPVGSYGEEWYEYEGKAYAVRRDLLTHIKITKQKCYDALTADLQDLIGAICSIEEMDDPSMIKGTRILILAVCLGLLEDSAYPELGMTRERFCFYNVDRVISQFLQNYETFRKFLQDLMQTSKTVSLSRQLLSVSRETLNGYLVVAAEKLSLFQDEAICSLTSSTDVDPLSVAKEPTVLFLEIPREKDARYSLTEVFLLCLYQALVRSTVSGEDTRLPRNLYFLLNGFGTMPKLDGLDKMLTMGRSRKIWFQMVIGSYAQFCEVYGDTAAKIIQSNCGMKLFLERDELSKLPRRNNRNDVGNALIATFGNPPLKTKFPLIDQCPFYEIGAIEQSAPSVNAFCKGDISYDLEERNSIMKSVCRYHEVTQEMQELREISA